MSQKVKFANPGSPEMQILEDAALSTPLRHPPFDEEWRSLMVQIKTALDEVFPQSLLKWEDGFRRDTHIESEVAYWLALAEVYTTRTEGRGLDMAQKKAIFKDLLQNGWKSH